MKKIMTVVCIFITTFCFAQQKEVKGVVTGKADGSPLAGVTVTGEKNATSTDVSGKFSITASIGETLTFSYVGMNPVSVKVTAAAELSIQMEPSVKEGEQIVIVGYSTQRKQDLTGAVAVVDLNPVKNTSSGKTMQALQGRVAGL